jgi:hypothetical protein
MFCLASKRLSSVDEMADMQYMVLIIQYEQDSQKTVEGLIKNLSKSIGANHGSIQRAYQGSEERIVSAVQKILKLTE